MFYANFSTLCKINGTTMTFVCKDLGISTSNVTNWKTGAVPNIKKVQQIADYFHVDPAVLLADNLPAIDVSDLTSNPMVPVWLNSDDSVSVATALGVLCEEQGASLFDTVYAAGLNIRPFQIMTRATGGSVDYQAVADLLAYLRSKAPKGAASVDAARAAKLEELQGLVSGLPDSKLDTVLDVIKAMSQK